MIVASAAPASVGAVHVSATDPFPGSRTSAATDAAAVRPVGTPGALHTSPTTEPQADAPALFTARTWIW